MKTETINVEGLLWHCFWSVAMSTDTSYRQCNPFLNGCRKFLRVLQEKELGCIWRLDPGRIWCQHKVVMLPCQTRSVSRGALAYPICLKGNEKYAGKSTPSVNRK